MSLAKHRIFVIGTGNMGGAIVQGLCGRDTGGLAFYDIDPGKTKALSAQTGLPAAAGLAEGLRAAGIVILAVKPQQYRTLLAQAGKAFSENQIVMSIMAGIPLEALRRGIQARVSLVRAMPNTPALVGRGLTAVSGEDPEALALSRAVFSCLGEVIAVEESAMDAVTALSGAGPAYVYAFLEAFIRAAEDQGFAPEQAAAMVCQTAKGALALLSKSGQTPASLRRQVTSPGGVTEAALRAMDALGLPDLLKQGVAAGVRRAGELGR